MMEAENKINYLITEDQSIGPNGTKTHWPNSVTSMLNHYFTVKRKWNVIYIVIIVSGRIKTIMLWDTLRGA